MVDKDKDYSRFRDRVEYYMTNQWATVLDNDRMLIQDYFNNIVVNEIPKGEPLLKCVSCSSSWWNALKTAMNWFAYLDKKQKEDELSNKRTDSGGDNNNETPTVKPVNKKSSKK